MIPETSLPRILVVDDNATNVKLLDRLIGPQGFEIVTATSGAAALALIEQSPPDLVLLDVIMPHMSGYEVCRAIRENPKTRLLPVIMVTALDPSEERVKGIEAGADDFLEKPINAPELLARMRSLLKTAELHKQVQAQAAELADLNLTLEQRVHDQVDELERVSQLKRFLPPQVAELIMRGETHGVLDTHRRNVTIAFINLHGFATFAESEEPEIVIATLGEYHAEMGRLVQEHEGTLERFTGDAMMVVFNDPIEIKDPERRALHMVLAMRDAVDELRVGWERDGFELGFGAGVTAGYATIGAIGFEGRMEYAAIGHPVNLAARLGDICERGQILVAQRVKGAIDALADVEALGDLQLKGIPRSTRVYQVLRLKGDGPGMSETRRMIGPGATLDRDHYAIERVLGIGGMATAYLGRDKRLDRRIVIKIPHEKLMSQSGFRERFHRELRSVTRLNHPNIVKVYDAGEELGMPYAVVQYLAGGELKERMKTPQTLDEVLAWLPGVADALDYIHREDILHRDIKPDNILFDASGRAYVSDFGIAKALTDGQDVVKTEEGYIVGAFRYIAPEYVRRHFSPACDQYSLAVVVYEALSQRFPHAGTTAEEIVREKFDKPPTPLDESLGLPAEANHAVLRALAGDPRDRFESCAAFVDALVRA